MIDLSAVVAYLSAISMVGAVVYLIMLERRHPAVSRVRKPVSRRSTATATAVSIRPAMWESSASTDKYPVCSRPEKEDCACIRLVIAEDEPALRACLRRLLEAQPDIEVVGEAVDGVEAVKLARELKPDILTTCVAMPNKSGFDVLRELNRTPARVVLWTQASRPVTRNRSACEWCSPKCFPREACQRSGEAPTQLRYV